MSNRSSYQRVETNSNSNRGFNKTQKQKFVPKNSNSSSSAAPRQQENSNNPAFQKKFVPKSSSAAPPSDPHTANSNVSASHHRAFSRQSDKKTAIDIGGGASATGSRVRLGENGEWISNRILNGGGGKFVNYLPQDEAVAAGLGVDAGGLDPVESQRAVDLLNRELSRLLKLNTKDFWREVATDASLHEFLDSFLQFRSRWYDFPYHGSKGIVAGVVVGENELSRRVFMVLYRISSNKDPGARTADSLSSKEYAAILQNIGLLDLPKLLDICAIYGRDNQDLTKSLIVNAVRSQSTLHDKFNPTMSHLMGIVNTMYQRCSSSLQALISGGSHGNHGPNVRYEEYLEVLDFLNDAVVSIDAFAIAYKPSALLFSCPIQLSHGNEELIYILARLYDSLLPQLQNGLQIILAAGGDGHTKSSSILSDASVSLKVLSARILDLGWKLVDYCYLSDEVFRDGGLPPMTKMFPADVEDPVIRGDIIIQTFKEIAAVPQNAQENRYRGTFLQSIEKHYQVMQRIEGLQSSGWIQIDSEQFQYLASLLMHPLSSIPREPKINSCTAPTSRVNDQQIDEAAAISESKISQIRDLFPDYGKGYLSACLEVYNHNPEEVIQRILDGTLHKDLQALDSSLEVLPRKPTASVNNKGKAKLEESPLAPSLKMNLSKGKEGPVVHSSSSASSTGRFVRKPKVAEPNYAALDSKDEMHMQKTAALLSQLEYEDEYDDSFDDLGMTVMDSGAGESEFLRDRMNSGGHSSSGRGRGSGSNAPNPSASSRWGSRKQPQYYVKDGKNYSYKVEGAVAVANYDEATLMNQAQKETVHGLGRGGNIPHGAVRKIQERTSRKEGESDEEDVEENGGEGSSRGRGRGRGGRGRGRGGNHSRKDGAMKKHLIGLGGM